MKNNRLLNPSVVLVVSLLHAGIIALAWEARKPPEPVSVDNLTFVDLGSLDGNDQPAADGAPAPLESKPAEPEPVSKPTPPPVAPTPPKPEPVVKALNQLINLLYLQPKRRLNQAIHQVAHLLMPSIAKKVEQAAVAATPIAKPPKTMQAVRQQVLAQVHAVVVKALLAVVQVGLLMAVIHACLMSIIRQHPKQKAKKAALNSRLQLNPMAQYPM